MSLENEQKGIQIEVSVPFDLEKANQTSYTLKRKAAKVQRNQPCTCGSGHKAKKCCYSPY